MSVFQLSDETFVSNMQLSFLRWLFSRGLSLSLITLCLCDVFGQFGFRKWKGNVTERPIEDRSDIIKELYSDLTIAKPQEGAVIRSDFDYENLHAYTDKQDTAGKQ